MHTTPSFFFFFHVYRYFIISYFLIQKEKDLIFRFIINAKHHYVIICYYSII